MFKSKTFVKKTRKGGIVKVVREHYLRNDVYCGSEVCEKCDNDPASLESAPVVNSSVCSFQHYILPDTNVLLHQTDFLEHKAIRNCIILETVLDEVKNRSISVYRRIRTLCGDSSRNFFVFLNEHFKETYVEREEGESVNDRNDRAIREAVAWYNEHFLKQDAALTVVLLSNDNANVELAKKNKLAVYSVREYADSLTDYPELQDIVSEEFEEQKNAGKDSVLYKEYISGAEIQRGIKNQSLLQGTFNVDRDFSEEGSIIAKGQDGGVVLILGQENMNRAIKGDVVAVKLLPKSEWKRSGSGEEMSMTKTGKVVGIVKRNWRPYCGVLLKKDHVTSGKSASCLFLPTNRCIPRIRISTRQYDALAGMRLVVVIDAWDKISKYPRGHFVRSLGQVGDRNTENEVLLMEHDVPYQAFAPKVLADLPDETWSLTDTDLATRRDLRDIAVCSVDPPGCTDIDDALHCIPLPNGNFQVGVHIADVTHFVKPNTHVDLEAANRGTTVYLTDKRIDMLPEILGTNLCSLRSKVDRLAFSCTWEMTSEGAIVSTDYFKSIIRSQASLTYEEAQLRIDDPKDSSEITISLRQLDRLAKTLRRKRMHNGALDLASPEVNFNIDSETHDPVDVKTKELRSTNRMVEEFMLLANISVAKRIYEHFPQSACLRRHPSPPVSNFEPLVQACKTAGFKIDPSTSKNLADSLDLAIKRDTPYFNVLVRILATRCMMQAIYFSSGSVPSEEFKHYGLATPIYTHFTSPIRRYSDVMVHRELSAAIGWAGAVDDRLLSGEKVSALCDNLNHRHRMAQYAARASVNLHTHLYFKGKVVVEEAYVLKVKKDAVVIIVPKYGLEAPLFLTASEKKDEVDELADVLPEDVDAIAVSEDAQSITVRGHRFQVFDKIVVRMSITADDPQKSKLNIELISPKIAGISKDIGANKKRADDVDCGPRKAKKARVEEMQ
eukprot:Nk52_evm26s238 gene=Nk52_evmTU26s238